MSSLTTVPDNKQNFITGQKNVTAAGTAESLGSGVIPDGFALVIKAKVGNTGVIRVGNTQANAQNTAVAFTLKPLESISLSVTELDMIWIDATVSGEGVEYMVER